MTDIVERLRERTVTPYLNGIHSELQVKDPTELELEAADTIEALRAENSRLREALKPFAVDDFLTLTVADLRAARAAMGER